ncbi:Gene late control D protein [Escherichia coli]|uniref:phage late control D family protein n=1 Tax=Escherichia coli TaxID=562 RepID=UPI000DFE6F50|nr:phage late control D family protein [Escherichia coli]STI98433.1 Gene late control D protein [Escherichia coli]
MTDTTMQLLSQGTDPVKMPDFDILAEGKALSGVAERLMSLSLTDNRGFEADQLTITLDDAGWSVAATATGRASDGSHWLERGTADRKRHLHC